MRKRKWVVAGLVLIAIGVGAYLFSQPRRGTIDYHKQKYAELGMPEWVLKKGVPAVLQNFYERRFVREFEFHRSALIELGYLERRLFVVTNRTPGEIVDALLMDAQQNPQLWEYSGPTPRGRNNVEVIAPAEKMTRWEKVIREADVPGK